MRSEQLFCTPESYETNARVQQIAAAKLACLLGDAFSAQRMLDFGCGTALLAKEFAAKMPLEYYCGVDFSLPMLHKADENLACLKKEQQERHSQPFDYILECQRIETYKSSTRFEMIASSFALQWIDSFPEFLNNCSDYLLPEGILAMAVPVAPSLSQLENLWQANTSLPWPGLLFQTFDYYASLLASSHFELLLSKEEDETIAYPSSLDALRSFRSIGADFASMDAAHRRPSLAEVRDILESHSSELHWRVGYFLARLSK